MSNTQKLNLQSNSLPTEQKGNFEFSDFIRDERKMNQLFEAFLRNFYTIEQNQYKVKGEHIKWQFSSNNEEDLQFLPLMKTDITLENKNSKIIIDAKFYKQTLKKNFGKEKISSANLYQLFSYLLNQRKSDHITETATGILIYPTIENEYDLHYKFHDHKIILATVLDF